MIIKCISILYKVMNWQTSTVYIKQSMYVIYPITYLECIKNLKDALGKFFVFATNHSIGRNLSQIAGFKLINTFPGAIFAQQLKVGLIAS